MQVVEIKGGSYDGRLCGALPSSLFVTKRLLVAAINEWL
jgi:hypothetical protein